MFALILCFQSFGSVGVSASDNLIDPDLTNWDTLDDDIKVVWTKGYYQLQIKHFEYETGNHCIGAIYDLSSLNAGYSYRLNFHLLSGSEMGLADSRVYNQLNYGPLVIGLASYDSSLNVPTFIDGCYIEVTKDNYSKYFGYDTSFTFTLPNVENPCICIYYIGLDNTVDTYFGFKNVSLIDTEAEKEQGFLDKLFTWFQEKFNAIGESFTNLGNKLTDLKDGFINKIIELKTSFENKITDLKQSFQAKIEELKQGLIDLKDNLIEGIKSLFVPDEQAILDWKESLNTLLKNHLGIIYTCSELLTDTLNLAFDIIFDAPDTYEIKIPEVSFEAAGTTVPVFSAQNIDFSFMEKPVFKTLYSMYTVAMYIFFGALEVKYALRVYRKVMNN